MIKVTLPDGTIQEKADVIYKALLETFDKNILSFRNELEKQVYKSFGSTISDAYYKKIVDSFATNRLKTVNELKKEFSFITGEFINSFDIAKEAKENIYRTFDTNYLGDLTVQLMGIENDAKGIIANIMKINSEYDYSFLKNEMKNWGNDVKKNSRKFIELFQGDYEQEYMKAIMRDSRIEKMIDGDDMLLRFKNGGRKYNIENMIDELLYSNHWLKLPTELFHVWKRDKKDLLHVLISDAFLTNSDGKIRPTQALFDGILSYLSNTEKINQDIIQFYTGTRKEFDLNLLKKGA